MKITFSLKSEDMVRSTIAAVLIFASKLEAKTSVNFDYSTISIDIPNDANAEKFIDFIFDKFEISKIDIENGTFVPTNSNTKVVTSSVSNVIPSFEDFESTNAEFDDETIENLISKLSKSLSWLSKVKNVRSNTIAAYLLTLKTELQLSYANENHVEFAAGNLVEIYFGLHMTNETLGISTIGVVIETLENNLAFIVPIGGYRENEVSLKLVKDQDFTYFFDFDYDSTYAILSRGQFINSNRVNKIVGKINSDALTSLKNALPNAFNFTNKNIIMAEVSSTSNNNDDVNEYVALSSFKKFLSTHNYFTTKDLFETFENVPKNTIYNWVYYAKKKGIITSEKRGEYKVNT